MAFKALHGVGPPTWGTISLPIAYSDHNDRCAVPQTPHTCSYLKAFAPALSSACNARPTDIYMDSFLTSFRALLKGHHLRKAFPNYLI